MASTTTPVPPAPSPHARQSRTRRAARFSLIACPILALVGLVIASVFGDDTPPYDDALIAVIGWSAYLFFGAATLVLAVPYWIMLILEDSLRGRHDAWSRAPDSSDRGATAQEASPRRTLNGDRIARRAAANVRSGRRLER